MSAFLFLLGCFESSVEQSIPVVKEAVVEKSEQRVSNHRIEEYQVSHIYKDLPQYVYAANEGDQCA